MVVLYVVAALVLSCLLLLPPRCCCNSMKKVHTRCHTKRNARAVVCGAATMITGSKQSRATNMKGQGLVKFIKKAISSYSVEYG